MSEAERRKLLRPRRSAGARLSFGSAAGATCVAGAIVGVAAFLLPATHASKSATKQKLEPSSVAGQEVSAAFGQLASAEPSAGAALLAPLLKDMRREPAAVPAAPAPSTAPSSAAAAQPPAPEPAPPAPQAAARAAPQPAGKAIDPAEAEALLKRSEAFVAQGDIASARLLLQRAAGGGHARAALLLAGTYDPAMLRKLQVYGVPGDSAKAREWYEQAHALGAPEASGRLEVLARAGQ